jgi:hypothetical protein
MMPFSLDYDRCIHLDAEDLAEAGVRDAYERVLPELRKYLSNPAAVEEVIDDATGSYFVRCGKEEYAIGGPKLPDEAGESSWGRATFAFFHIVNGQLVGSDNRFYAINGGNDLGGMFLTAIQARAAQDSLPDARDWPYIPTNEPPWYGQYH